jgi:subtilisin family serine protease
MIHRLIVVALLLTAFSSISEGGIPSSSPGSSRKQLPLDAIPNAPLKTREHSEYLQDRVIIKLMPRIAETPSQFGLGIGSIDEILSRLSVRSVEGMFPIAMAERGQSSVDLSRFYVVRYSAPIDPFSAAAELSQLPEVQYAEPWFIYPLSYDPNDPSFPSQYGLTKIQAPAAWDITQGDTSVVIGIVDSGVEVAHPDLAANIWHNPGEMGDDAQGRDKRTNNEDDDGNGYVDDWQGWDFGGADYNNVVPDNDPNPTAGNNAHGTHVAGIASAATDNGIGVAGTGFRCRLLAIKTTADNDFRGPGGSAYIIAGIQGIAYAATMGAQVMNCSWGGGGGSQVEQDIITWATDQGSLIVAAAGNSNTSAPHFPSAYQNVISVAATGSTDVKASYSNYGHTVDVSAPGDAIYSTYYPSTYANLWGTSMASPHAAGSAALIKVVNPGFTALQVGERLRVTCDDINGINPSYTDLLGKGRINVYRALTEDPPSIRASEITVSDSAGGNNNGNPEPNEVIDILYTFTNYLAPTSNAVVTFTETSPYLTVVDGEFIVGSLGTLSSVRNDSEPFQVSIAGNVPAGHVATVKLLINDGAYSDFQWFTLVINPTFQSHEINDVHVTMTNNGRVGWNDYPTNTQGIGFLYPASSLNHIFEGGLIMGYSATKLVNNIRINSQQSQDNDFLARTIFELETPGVISNQDGYTWFSDSSAPIANRIGLRVDEFTYAYSSVDDTDYVIMRYDITNLSASTVSGIYVGQFYDWDISNYATNRTGFDASRSLAYAWDSGDPTAPHIGVRALDSVASCRGLVNSGLTIDRAAKWNWISGGTGQSTVGPGDIFFVISSGPYSIDPGEVIRLGFALIGGADLADLQVHADAARAKWDEILTIVAVNDEQVEVPAEFSLEQNYPNPFNPSTVITFTIPQTSFVTLKVFDLLGREVKTLVEGTRVEGRYSVVFDAEGFPSGTYFYQLKSGSSTATRKLTLVK